MNKKSIIKLLWIVLLVFVVSCSKKNKSETKIKISSDKVSTSINTLNTLDANIHTQRLIPKIKLKEAENALKNKEYEKALNLYNTMLKMDKLTAEDRSQLFAGKAETLFYLKRYEESQTSWEKVISIRPTEPFAYQNLALVQSESGNSKEALKTLDKILKLDQDILSARLDKINLMSKLGFSKQLLIKEAELFAQSLKHLNTRLIKAYENKNVVEINRIFGYYLEIPEETPSIKILLKIINMKSIVVQKAVELILRHKKGKDIIKNLIKESKDPLKKRLLKGILSNSTAVQK